MLEDPAFGFVRGFPLTVAAGRLFPANCEVDGDGTEVAVAGRPARLTILARDAAGNVRADSGADDSAAFLVTARSGAEVQSGVVTLLGGGRYLATYTLTTAGDDLTVAVSAGGQSVGLFQGGSVLPSEVDSASCLVFGAGVSSGRAGEPMQLFVQARDLFGNVVPGAEEQFLVSAASLEPVVAASVNASAGLFAASLTLPHAGSFRVSVTHVGDTVYQGIVAVAPGPPEGFMVQHGFPAAGMLAGAPSSLTVVVRDSFGNARDAESDAALFALRLDPLGGGEAQLLQLVPEFNRSSGELALLFRFTPPLPGVLSLFFRDPQPQPTDSSPYQAAISPGAIDTRLSAITGAGFEAGAAEGVSAAFVVTLVDDRGVPLDDEALGLELGPPVAVEFSLPRVAVSGPTYLGGGAFGVEYVVPSGSGAAQVRPPALRTLPPTSSREVN